jgi:hypothetical protein
MIDKMALPLSLLYIICEECIEFEPVVKGQRGENGSVQKWPLNLMVDIRAAAGQSVIIASLRMKNIMCAIQH